jgi:mono/diheme cytochrome c family protein
MSAKIALAGIVASAIAGVWCEALPRPALVQTEESARLRSVWDGVFSENQAKRGHQLYEARCASCHADSLLGGEAAPPLVGGEFLSNWNELTVGDLFERIRTSMPLNKPKSLTREETADILAYMLSVNKFPSGPGDLAHDTQLLKQIRIENSKSGYDKE